MATIPSSKTTIVVGGGWAGLACAYALTHQGHRVTVLEAAPQCGGRARSVPWHALGIEIDNGQHLLLGAYQAFLNILPTIGVHASEIFDRHPFELWVHGPHKTTQFSCKMRPYLPPAWSLGWDLLMAKGHSWTDKYQLARFITHHVMGNVDLPMGLSALDLLKHAGQSDELIQHFWTPLLVAALSTPLEKASALYACQVLKDTFSGKTGHSDILLPKVSLGDVFAKPMTTWLKQQGQMVFTHQRALSLIVSATGKCVGVQTKTGHFWGRVVLALPPRATRRLLPSLATLRPLSDQLSQLGDESIVTLYYAFSPVNARLFPMMQAIVSADTHCWLFYRNTPAHCLVKAVFSGTGTHLKKDKTQLMDDVQAMIRTRYPNLGTVLARKYIQEKFAAFSADIMSHALKPTHQTVLPGLWLCGDYTHPVYPATLEGAVQSGLSCAADIQDNLALI